MPRTAVTQLQRALEQEIAAHQRTQEQLERSNARITDLLEQMSAGFFSTDHELRVTYINAAGERLTGLRREDCLGRNVWDVFPAAQGTPFEDALDRVRAEQVAVDEEAYYAPAGRWRRARLYPTPESICTLFEDFSERHTQELEAFGDILRALNAHLDVAQAFPIVAETLSRLTGCAFSNIALFDERKEWLTYIALSPSPVPVRADTRWPVGVIPSVPDMLAGRPRLVPDLALERDWQVVDFVYQLGFRSGLSLPLRGTRGVTGLLGLTWRQLGGPKTEQVPLLGQIADAIALAVEKRELFEQVREGGERLKATSQRLIEVQESERRHLGRELHDEIGQQLTGIKLLLQATERLPAEADVRRFAEVHNLVDEAITRVRELSLDLRPAMLDDFGLMSALSWLFGRCAAQGKVLVAFEPQGLNRRLAPETETAAYRIIQEALTNVTRHARVREVQVRLWVNESTLRAQIIDHGVGFDVAAALARCRSCGLSAMRERASLLGGRVTVESAAGAGTRVDLELPLAADQSDAGASSDRSA